MDSSDISRLYGNVVDASPEVEDVPLLQKLYWPLTLGLIYFFSAVILGLALV